MTRLRLIGWSAMAVCVLGYGGGIALIAAGQMDRMDEAQSLIIGGVVLLIGEIGLWVAAGCLGLTIFKRRQAIFNRLFKRREEPAEPV